MTPLIELAGESREIRALREKVGRLLRHHSESNRVPPILIQGETGTGKGLLARAIHRAGPRRAGPFVDVNCAAIPETLLEAEMFGFERGAFTDARQAKPGLFQAAHRGTIFLDEVGLLPDAVQGKLLKAIEERQVRRLGSTRSEAVDTWIITATSADLARATRERRFQDALYHRLSVITLWLPPLRDRGQDVVLLAEQFLARECEDYGLPAKSLAPDARAALLAYHWPGNVRELTNVIERTALLTEAHVITADVLGLGEARAVAPPAAAAPAPAALADAIGSVERTHLVQALTETGWNVTRAAARLGISRDTLRYRIEKYGLRPGTERGAARSRASHPAPPPEPARAPVEAVAGGMRWEQRRITLLRASLALSHGEGPAGEGARHLEALMEKVQAFGGRVEEMSPTAIVAAFGLEPVEDAPRRATHAAMAMKRLSDREQRPLRIAVHVGQFLVMRTGRAVEIDLDGKRGAWPVLEALAERAEPNTIVVSAASAPFLERRFDLVPLGALEDGRQAYRIAERESAGLGVAQQMARFVGRRHEMELLHNRLALATRGNAQVVGVVGEAGIGKSRLVFEFRQSVAGVRVACLEGRCLSYGSGVPYLPILDVLRDDCGISETDGAEAAREKLGARLREEGMGEEELPFLLHLLGDRSGTEALTVLTPEAIQARTFEILRALAVARSRRQPLLVLIEDVHWIDKASEAYLSHLVEALAGTATLLLLTYRPGYRPPWIEKSFATQVALQALETADSLSVVQSVLPFAIPDALVQTILAKGEGNPFFLEELARTVKEQGSGASAAVPDTVHEVLLARINRLPEPAKRLLQVASVLGREVALPLLDAIWEEERVPRSLLRELVQLEFLHESAHGEERLYHFKHALTQEVAYESLLAPQRQALHAAAGRALESLYAGRLQEVWERLAHHYANTSESEKAGEYLTRSAEKAARSNAHVEAVTALQEALQHAERLPVDQRDQRFLDLVLRQVRSFSYLGGNQKSLDLLLAQQERLDRLRDPRRAGPYFFTLGLTSSLLGDQERAGRSAQRALEEATLCRDEATMGKAYALLALESVWSGTPERGIEHGRQALVLLGRMGQRYWLSQTHLYLAFNHYLLGEVEAGLAAAREAQMIGEAIGHTGTQSYAAWTAGGIHVVGGDWEAGIAACRRGLDLSPDPLTTAQALGFLGSAYLEKGDPVEAIPLLEQSIELIRLFRFRQEQGWFTALLAEAQLLRGQLDRARDLATEGLQITREAKYWFGVAVAERALGRIDMAAGAMEDAERRLTTALRTFEPIPARFEAGRTRLALAELAHATGRVDVAVEHLAQAREIFTRLAIPIYVARTGELARKLGLPLPSRVDP